MESTPTFQVQPFGSYFLLERIAVGGMAEIFKAKQFGARGFEKIVVIKKILHHLGDDPEFVGMFEDEAKIAAQLQQNNIVQIYELGEVDGTLYITMEYVDGKNLRDITRAATNKAIHLSLEQSVFIVIEIMKGLDYAHRKKDASGHGLEIVHRDMSPQNIIVSYEGEVKILDFGIAKAASKISKTEAGVLKGKFSYMSPEQASGKSITQSSDVYACGVMLYELLTSQRLFKAKTDMETLEKVKKGEVTPPSTINTQIPSQLDHIVLKALKKEITERYQSASEMLTDLNQFYYGQGFSYSSQDLSIFMKTLFEDAIKTESKRLRKALEQIPATPHEKLKSARTHIAFKSPIEQANEFKEVTATIHSEKEKKYKKISLITILILAIIGFYWWQYQSSPKNESPPQIEEATDPQIPPEEPIEVKDTEPTEPPPPSLGNYFDDVAAPEKPEKKEKPPPSEAPAQILPTPKFGEIDVIAPGEGFATLFIDNRHFGTVPGPSARNIKLKEGPHRIRCETSTKIYSGKISVAPEEHKTVRCEELKD